MLRFFYLVFFTKYITEVALILRAWFSEGGNSLLNFAPLFGVQTPSWWHLYKNMWIHPTPSQVSQGAWVPVHTCTHAHMKRCRT